MVLLEVDHLGVQTALLAILAIRSVLSLVLVSFMPAFFIVCLRDEAVRHLLIHGALLHYFTQLIILAFFFILSVLIYALLFCCVVGFKADISCFDEC